MHIGFPNPSGQCISIEVVRRIEPFLRAGARPAGLRGAMAVKSGTGNFPFYRMLRELI